MIRSILLVTLLAGACAPTPRHVARFDLAQVQADTERRDRSPGFASLPDASGQSSARPGA